MPYVRAWADNSRQSLLRLTTSAAPSTMLTLSGGEAECAYGAGRLVRQRQPAALGTTAALAALSSRSV